MLGVKLLSGKTSGGTERICFVAVLILLLHVGLAEGVNANDSDHKSVSPVGFNTSHEIIFQDLNEHFCWFHPRAVIVPAGVCGEKPIAIMSLQKHLSVSDYYSGLYTMRSEDLGKTWSKPIAQPSLSWITGPGSVTITVANVTPGWHAPSGKLLAIGSSARHDDKGVYLSDIKRADQTAYAVFDPKTNVWSKWKTLKMPSDEKFDFSRCGCSQWIVDEDGTVLVPLYIGGINPCATTTVAKCSFDGSELKYIEHGSELSLTVPRGLYEPSLIRFRDHYYLTMRNDVKGYVSVSEDGLNYGPIKRWTFDDGTELGNYNTQQHWLKSSEGLFLVYTRRGANNDHVFRNRAPLFIAQVDPWKLQVIRDTEKIIVPERGAPLGNFGANMVDDSQAWVTVSELNYRNNKPNPRGANGSTFLGRVSWSAGSSHAP